MIIVDTNILIAAIIRNSTTRTLLLSQKYIAPYLIVEELEKHEFEIWIKSKLEWDEYQNIKIVLLSQVLIVPLHILAPYGKEAESLMRDIDIDDAMFIACGLACPGSVIWSDDPDLKKQKIVKVLTTKEMISR